MDAAAPDRWENALVADTRSARGPIVVMAVVDVLALLAFVVAGVRSHGEGAVVDHFLRNAVPLVVAWLVFAMVLGTYRRPGFATLWRTWLVAVPVALVVRSIWVGSPTGVAFLTFLAVAMAFTALFLAIGRGVTTLVTGRGYPEHRRA